MESRMDKYYTEKSQEYSRSKKNQKLYRQVYGNYDELDYLPVPDNSSEIDVEKLKEIVGIREEYHRNKKEEPTEEIKEEKHKIYDINELIEMARNSKPKENIKKNDIKGHNYLKTLESKELLKEDIQNAKNKEIKEDKNKGNTLSLEILSDLKGDTVVVEPMSSNNENDTNKNSDIPINNNVKNEDDKSFYSGSYKFSSKDFFDDDIGKIESNHSFIKILFIIVVIAICITGIYFLIN